MYENFANRNSFSVRPIPFYTRIITKYAIKSYMNKLDRGSNFGKFTNSTIKEFFYLGIPKLIKKYAKLC